MSEAEKAAAKRYSQALVRGRVATKKGDFAAAGAAFDEALKALPGDARALGERGFARLHTGDLDGAESDFYAALARTPDRAVLSATTYNLALVAEARGNKPLADQLREEARNNRVPRRADDACEVVVRRGKEVEGFGEMKSLQTLRQVRSELATYARDTGDTITPPLPTTNEEADLRTQMLGDRPGPWELKTGDSSHHLLFGKPGDYHLRLGAATSMGSRCGSWRPERIEATGRPLTMISFESYSPAMACFDDSGKQVEPSEKAQCQSACGAPFAVDQTTTVYDPATGDGLLSVRYSHDYPSENSPRRPMNVIVRPDGVQLLGSGCNRFEPFVSPAPGASGGAAPGASR